MLLYIDPGHGGSNSGSNNTGIIEKDLTLEVALELEEMINRVHWPIEVKMTRRDDKHLTLKRRGFLARKADLVLSIHADSYGDPRSRGMRTFHWPGNHHGKSVAYSILRAAPRSLWKMGRLPDPAYRSTYPRVVNVMQYHSATSVLVEMGFLTNASDRDALRSERIRRELLTSLLAGVARGLTLHTQEG